jgi:tRNA(fMet)-specific endonuclease VapC
LIAGIAIHHGLTVVTNNTAHFDRLPGLTLENWLEPPQESR